MNGQMGVTELNGILLNSMPKIWYNQSCVHVSYCRTIFLKAVDVFERMGISGSIYEDVITPSYFKNYSGRSQPYWNQ